MSADLPLYGNEHILRTGENIAIKSGRYRIVLTEMRIFLISDRGNKPAEIDLNDIESVDPDQHATGDPSVTLGVISRTGEIRTIILVFSPRNNRQRVVERDQWIADIRARTSRQRRQSPPPETRGTPAPAGYAARHPGGGEIAVPSQRIDPVFCSHCGKPAVPDALFCGSCGSRIVYPAYPSGAPAEAPERTARQAAPVESRIAVPERRKYQDIPLVPNDTGRAKGPSRPVKTSVQRKRMAFPGKAKLAAIAGIACVALVLIILFTGIAGPLDPLSILNMSGNASTAATPAASVTVSPEPAARVIPEATPEPTPEEIPAGTDSAADSNPPDTVFDQYLSSYNAGDAAGLYELLSANAKSANSLDSVTSSITAFMDSGVYIGAYDLISSDVQENSATLELDIIWVKQGEPVTVRETIPFVREDGLWKLEKLVVPAQ